jgi:hypothetical protein
MPRHRVFISYSHKDRVWLEALQVHLRPLEREQRITRWDDTLIQSGTRWKLEISKALDEARVAVLLVSKHFLASDFIAADELPPLLAAAEHEGALILPVLVGPCRFNRTPGLADYQAVNSPERTLMEMSEAEQDRVWLQLADRIEDALAVTVEPQRSEPRSERLVSRRGSASAPAQRGDGTESGDRLPDLYLLVRQEVADNRLLLSFQLKTRDGALGPDDRLYGPVVLAANPRSHFGDLFHDLGQLGAASGRDKDVIRLKLEAKGAFLFESLIPPDLAEVLWSLRGVAGSLLIQSEEGIIPWELFKLRRRSGGTVEEGPFLSEAFALTRWIGGYDLAPELAIDNIGWIAPRELNSRYQGDDFAPLARLGASVTAVPATFLGVHDALASGKFDVLHFSTHSSHAQGTPSQWKLYLEDHEALTPEDLVSAAANLGSKRPLVFLNACQTGLNAETITGVSGWATQFIRAGCGAFIGAYWNLDDRSANLFQATFYEGFLSGLTFGEAIRHARQCVRMEGNATWMSYTAYGNPAMRAVLRK